MSRSAAYDDGMEIEIAASGDGRYEVSAQHETDGPVILSSDDALKGFHRGMSETRIATIVKELQPAPRKIRVVVNPSNHHE